jgi:hypothetical protein
MIKRITGKHVNNVMDVYTQAKQIYLSLSGIIKLVHNCRIQWKLNVGVALSAQFSAYNRFSDASFFCLQVLMSHKDESNLQCVHF